MTNKGTSNGNDKSASKGCGNCEIGLENFRLTVFRAEAEQMSFREAAEVQILRPRPSR